MANETIGHTDCPVCGKQADVRVTKKSKAYIQCDDCGFQGFTRGHTSDKLVRERMRPKMKPVELKDDAPPMVVIHPKTSEPPPTSKEITIFDKEFWNRGNT